MRRFTDDTSFEAARESVRHTATTLTASDSGCEFVRRGGSRLRRALTLGAATLALFVGCGKPSPASSEAARRAAARDAQARCESTKNVETCAAACERIAPIDPASLPVCIIACDGGRGSACDQVGQDLVRARREPEALAYQEKGCELGDYGACAGLDVLLQNEKHATHFDRAKLDRMLTEGCAAKNGSACYALGYRHLARSESSAARPWMEKACSGSLSVFTQRACESSGRVSGSSAWARPSPHAAPASPTPAPTSGPPRWCNVSYQDCVDTPHGKRCFTKFHSELCGK